MALSISLPAVTSAEPRTARTSGAEWTPVQERTALECALRGRYRVESLIARGGMGSIWRGFEPGLERSVAIKVLAPGRARDQDDRGRFRREGRVLASLSHPGVIPVLSSGEDADVCWFAMPFVDGQTLADQLAARGRLPVDQARGILVELATALAHIHERGVVHRDVKPENVLLDTRAGRAVLTDFGIATVATSDHSRSEVVKGFGTTAYMAPEQILGSQASDGRTDLYALGVLGFHMLAGRLPFLGRTESEIAAQHVIRPAPSVGQYVTGLDEPLAAAIDRCLAKTPDERWGSASALAVALTTGASSRPARILQLGNAIRSSARQAWKSLAQAFPAL